MIKVITITVAISIKNAAKKAPFIMLFLCLSYLSSREPSNTINITPTVPSVGNILKKADVKSTLKVDQSLLKDDAEINLYKTLDLVDAESRKEYAAKNYSGSLKLLCKLKNPIDQFFKDVMVNAEDESLKMNRLALLEKLYSAMNLVADLSKLSS